MSSCGRTARTAERGLSLLELLIVISMTSVFIAAVYETVLVGLRVANASDEREEIRQEVTNALDLLTRELLLANNVDVAEDQQVQFDADLNADGTTESDILYRVQGGDLQRVYNSTAVTLVRDLTSLDFNYTDLNGSSLTAPVTGCSLDLLRVVQTTLSATKDAETVSAAASACLRNND